MQSAECQIDRSVSFVDYVGQMFDMVTGRTSILHYACKSFLSAAKRYRFDDIDANSLKLWVASMLLEGKSELTCQRYVGKLHNIYKGWKKAGDDDLFSMVLRCFADKIDYTPGQDAQVNASKISEILSIKNESPQRQMRDIFLYLLYAADARLDDVVKLTFDDVDCYCMQILDIVKAQDSSNGRKYLFNLNQSHARQGQIVRELNESLLQFMRNCGMRISGNNAREIITEIWIKQALKTDIDIRLLRSIPPTLPIGFKVLNLIEEVAPDSEQRKNVISEVANTINNNSSRWFIMRLRKGVKVENIQSKLDSLSFSHNRAIELFYPTRKEIRKTGKTRRGVEVAYTPSMLFFRTTYDNIKPLFSNIGDLAWCLKSQNVPNAPYSVIPHREMLNFQRCIGQISPGMRMEVMSLQNGMLPGRKVKIVGGLMAGYEGLIQDVRDENNSRRFFLRISHEAALNWTMEVEDVFIQPL